MNPGASDQIPSAARFDVRLPSVILPGNGVTITETARQLFPLMAKTGHYFMRGGRVMKLTSDEKGRKILQVHTPDEARSDFEKVANLLAWRKADNGDLVLKPVICSVDTANALLETEDAKELLPHIRGLMNCPMLFERDSELAIAGPGYNPETEMLITGGTMPKEVSVEEAVASLLELLREFDFQTDSDKSRMVAGWVSPVLKSSGLIQGRVPAVVGEANHSQSGKTYGQKVGVGICNEKVSLVTKTEGGVGSIDEKFGQQLEKGRPFIQFDNFRGRFDSPNLEAFMTADDSFPCRLPYKEYFDVNPEEFFVLMSSNGVETTRDFANRSNFVRIRKKPDGFHFQKYPEGDLLNHVRAKQPYYLGCVFAVVRAWHAAGKPRTDETRHDFREWVQVLDWIVQNIFKLPPIMDGHREAQERVSNPELCFLRAVALAIEQCEELGNPQTATEIAQICELENIKIPGAPPLADIDRLARLVGAAFGRIFRKEASIDLEGYRITRALTRRQRKDNQGYDELKSYTFERLGATGGNPKTDKGGANDLVEKRVVSFVRSPAPKTSMAVETGVTNSK